MSDDRNILPGTAPATVPPANDDEPATVHHGAMSRIRNYFLTGLILVGPIYITANLTWWLINWVDDVMRPFIPEGLRAETYLSFRIPGIGLIVAFVALTLLGFMTANLIGRKLVEFGESLLHRMPVVRPIYRTVKQVFETLFSKSGSSFRKVALVEFPTGMWSLVFLSQQPSVEVAERLPGDDFVSAFLPCTPNPTTGFFFFVPRKNLIEIDITVEQAMTLIMSAGMVQPTADAQKKLAQLAVTAKSVRRAPPAKPPAAAS